MTTTLTVEDPVQHRRMMGIARINLAKKDLEFYTIGPAAPVSFALAPRPEARLRARIEHRSLPVLDVRSRSAARHDSRRSSPDGRACRSRPARTAGCSTSTTPATRSTSATSSTYKCLRSITLDGDVTTQFYVVPSRETLRFQIECRFLSRMNLPSRTSLLWLFCLLPLALLGAAGPPSTSPAPMPAPEWAKLERRILADSVPAAKAFFAKLTTTSAATFSTSSDGVPTTAPDDAFENTAGWPELHALGASDEILQLHLRAWEGMIRQFTEARTTDVPIARQGIYYKDFSVQSDWMHHGEALRTFNVLALSAPALTAYQKRARTYAAFYLGEDRDAPNYDPQHKIIKSMINGSRGPMLRKATSLDWVGDPFDVSKFIALHGEGSYEQFLAHYQDTPTSSAITSSISSPPRCRSTPISWTTSRSYKRWLVEYMDAWLARMKQNGGVIPSYVALDGTIGGPEGKWWNNAYGWGFSPVNPVTGKARRSQSDSAGDGRIRQRAARHGRSELRRRVARDDRRGQFARPHGRRAHRVSDDVRGERVVWLANCAVGRGRARGVVLVDEARGSAAHRAPCLG